MANGFELDPRNVRVGKLVYSSNPRIPGVVVALLSGRGVRIHWLSGRVSEQGIRDLYDFELRIDTYAQNLADYQAAAQRLLAQPHP